MGVPGDNRAGVTLQRFRHQISWKIREKRTANNLRLCGCKEKGKVLLSVSISHGKGCSAFEAEREEAHAKTCQ